MNPKIRIVLAATLSAVAAPAQVPGPLLTFDQPVTLQFQTGPLSLLQPNEIAWLPWPFACSNGLQAVKWCPRSALNVMAGDDDGNGEFDRAAMLGAIDALALPRHPFQQVRHDPRSVWWSPTAALGTAVSATPLRPGDVGRIVGPGQVELLISQEQFNTALGLPSGTAIDIDAFAHDVGLGIYFSLDNHLTLANPGCAPSSLVQDGDLLAIPDSAITWSLDWRVVSVQPSSAYVVVTEQQFDAMLQASQITDRFGQPITAAGDLEALEIDYGPGSQITLLSTCSLPVPVPDFLFATESMTGGSILRTVGGGTVPTSSCGPSALQLPLIQTGAAVGITGSPLLGPAAHVNAIALADTVRAVLEPQQHTLNYGLLGGPPTTVHIGSDQPFVFTWVELVAPPVAPSFPLLVLSAHAFPDWYCPSNLLWSFNTPVAGTASFQTPTIPVGWSGKLLFQSVGLDSLYFEISTPCVLDVH